MLTRIQLALRTKRASSRDKARRGGVCLPTTPQYIAVALQTAMFMLFGSAVRQITDIQNDITRLSSHSPTGGERNDAIDHVLASIARLGTEVNNASSYLPAYDQRTYNEAVKALGTKLAEAREKFAPRQKFSFKNKSRGHGAGLGSVLGPAGKNESAISLGDAAVLADERRKRVPGHEVGSEGSSSTNTPLGTPSLAFEPKLPSSTTETMSPTRRDDATSPAHTEVASRVRRPSFSHSSAVTISNHTSICIALPSMASHATSSGTLSNLHRCVVDLSEPSGAHPFAGLSLKNISDSVIICGRVDGAAHLTALRNCLVVVQSRQVRIHESRDCDMYLATSSRPIIEDCHAMRLAPLPRLYGGDDVAEEEISGSWRDVDDFKWLKNEPSPNWRVLAREERVTEEEWQRVRGLGLEDVLQGLGLPAHHPAFVDVNGSDGDGAGGRGTVGTV
nr:tubulin-folding cofactor c [Quercus suber]